MFNAWPIPVEIEFRAVFGHMALLAGLNRQVGEAALGGLRVFPLGAVAHFALHVFEFGRVDFADESTRLVEPSGVADQTFRVIGFVDLLQSFVGVTVARCRPGFMC